MTQQEILDFISKNPACTLATCEGDKPRVRGMMIYKADKDGIILHTGAKKDLVGQMKSNPNVELCFIKDHIQIRISGVAAMENDVKLKEAIVADRPFLKPMVEQYGMDVLSVFRIGKLVATVWSMEANFAPKEYIEIQ